MYASMVISRSTNEFGVGRNGEYAFHTFQVDWTHMIERLNQLLLFDAVQQSFFTLQGGWIHVYAPHVGQLLYAVISPYGHIKLYVVGYQNVKVNRLTSTHRN